MTESTRGRAIGVGGIFFRSKNPGKLALWYSQHLGIDVESWGDTHGASFRPAEMPENSFTVWSVFKADTEYFGPSGQSFMFNLVVDDLDAALARVVAGGAKRLPDLEEHDFGRFGWFTDPDGNRVELWEPPTEAP
jgi:predicted enzyme related to lactoylglutathione lyase